ncbi:MAG: M48 family metallopeptidase, partial [Planctomycetota bacterium]|nr:M48 family metallopeptidase [Planctomycetota bacterium]
MAMNFFDHQENARRSSRRLVIMFAVAVVALISAFYFFFAFIGIWLEAPGLWQPRTLLWVAGSTILLGGLACWHKISSLRGGGAAVARMLGASRVVVSSDKGDPDEQRYVNVVEEMAIAAGVPVPDIYVMRKEENINAFAAGYSVDDAAVAVTRGCIKQLNRDELQGVVAHEFSHILNGDMRLNILMIGVLAGILFLFAIGYVLFRIGAVIGEIGEKAGILGLPFVVVGGGTCLIGWLGHLFGSVIKAAVSRQREFLADASAVQFTRNPRGIAGALRKIGGYGAGELKSPKASDVAHMCFTSVGSVDFRTRVFQLLGCTGILFVGFLVIAGLVSSQGVDDLWPLLPTVLLGLVVFQVVGSGLFYLHGISTLTHPPLSERIARIMNVRVEAIGTGPAQGGGPLAAGTAGIAGGPVAARKRKTRRKRKAVRTRARDVVKSAGALTPAAIENAMDTVAGIPAGLSEAGRHPFSAKCLCYLLVLPADKGERRELIKSILPDLISASELKELVRLEHEMP